MPVVCLSGMGAAHGFPHAFTKNNKDKTYKKAKNKQRTLRNQCRKKNLSKWEGCQQKRWAHLQIKSCNFRSSCVKAWKHTRDVKWRRRGTKTGLAQSFSKLIINGALGSPVTKSRVWLVFIRCTKQQFIHHRHHPPLTTRQMTEYEGHSTKLVPKPTVTFQTGHSTSPVKLWDRWMCVWGKSLSLFRLSQFLLR